MRRTGQILALAALGLSILILVTILVTGAEPVAALLAAMVALISLTVLVTSRATPKDR